MQKKKTIIIGVESNDYYPHYQLLDGEVVGYVRDLTDAYAREKNVKIELRSMPLRRIVIELKKGNIHLKYPDNPKWNKDEKEGLFKHSQPIISYIDGTLVTPDNLGKRIERIDILGTLIGFTPWPYFNEIEYGNIQVEMGRTLEGIIKRTLESGNDAVYANVDVANYLMKNNMKQPNALVLDEALPYARSYYSMSTVHYPELLDDFNTWQLNAAPLKQKLERKYELGVYGIQSQLSEKIYKK